MFYTVTIVGIEMREKQQVHIEKKIICTSFQERHQRVSVHVVKM